MPTKQAKKSINLTLVAARPKWVTLDEPDRKFKADGAYGIGVVLTQAHADQLNEACRAVAEAAELPAPHYEAGDVAKFSMDAVSVSRKTGIRHTETVLVYGPDNKPLTDKAEIQQISKKSIVSVAVVVNAYPAFGKTEAGISTRMAAVQVLKFVDETPPEASDFGFSPTQEEF